MDPTETLEIIREIVATYDSPIAEDADAFQLAEKFRALDRWLSEGGFPPDAWLGKPSCLGRMRELELRAYRLRRALLEAGVPENLVRAIELGSTEQEAQSGAAYAAIGEKLNELIGKSNAMGEVVAKLRSDLDRLWTLSDVTPEASDDANLREHTGR